MASTSELFEQYEADYCQKSTDLAKKLQVLASLPPGQRRSQAKYLEQTINEAEQVLQRLDMEARSSSPTQSRQQIQKVKDYRSDLSKLRTDIRKAASSASSVAGTSTSDASARAELGLGNDFYQTSAGQRDRLLTATDRLNQTSDRLQQGRAQLLETEELGVSILSDLQRQRESILQSRDRVADIDSTLSQARTILGTMSRRITQNKVIAYGIIALLVGAIGLVMWKKL